MVHDRRRVAFLTPELGRLSAVLLLLLLLLLLPADRLPADVPPVCPLIEAVVARSDVMCRRPAMQPRLGFRGTETRLAVRRRSGC